MNARDGRHAMFHLVLAIVVGALAFAGAPNIHSEVQHDAFIDLFVASSAVIAALLVALAFEARSVAGSTRYALAIVGMLGLGEICSVVALSPHLESGFLYKLLFAVMSGCGVAGLAAVADASVRLLSRDVLELSRDEIEQLKARRDTDAAAEVEASGPSA
jgi:FtsH-binding integral membrane protein